MKQLLDKGLKQKKTDLQQWRH